MFAVIGLWGFKALAAEELLVRQEIQVYSEADKGSEVLLTLERGERVPISSQEYGHFRKVLIDSGGKKRVGYVLISEVEGSRIREKKDSNTREKSLVYHRKNGLGVPITMSYLTQSGWKFQGTDGSATEISSLSGTAVFFGFTFDIPVDLKWSLRTELNLRKSNMTGTARPVGGGDKQLERTTTFVSFGLTGKYYFEAEGNFWIGAGFEIAKANNVTLIFANTENVPVADSDFPTYFLIKTGFGQDFKISGDLYLNPEVRALVALNSSPMVLGAELAMTLAYGF